MVEMLDPLSVADLVLRAIILTGFTCFFRANSYQLLTWKDLTFTSYIDTEGNLHVEVVVDVPDIKAVAFGAALGGVARKVKLEEFHVRDLCVVRTLVALGAKMGVFDRDMEEACLQQRFVVRKDCSTWFVFPMVEGGILSHDKTVSMREGGGVCDLVLYVVHNIPCFFNTPPTIPTTPTSLTL